MGDREEPYLRKRRICRLRSICHRAGGARLGRRCASLLQPAAGRGDALPRLQIRISRLRWPQINRGHRLFPHYRNLSPETRRRCAGLTGAIRRRFPAVHGRETLPPDAHQSLLLLPTPPNRTPVSCAGEKLRRRRRNPSVAGEIARAEMGNGTELSLSLNFSNSTIKAPHGGPYLSASVCTLCPRARCSDREACAAQARAHARDMSFTKTQYSKPKPGIPEPKLVLPEPEKFEHVFGW